MSTRRAILAVRLSRRANCMPFLTFDLNKKAVDAMAHFSNSGDISRTTERLVNAVVVDADGNQATIDSIQQAGPDGPDAQALVRMAQGTQIQVPLSLLVQQDDGMYRLPFSFHAASEQQHAGQMTFPLMEEELHVGKRMVDTGKGVRIHKTVAEREQVLDEPLLCDRLVVEHVPVGRVVADADAPQTRYEGDTLVVPVLEEVLVVQKQLLLKEEVRITRQRRPVQESHTVRLRSEQIAVEHFDEGRPAERPDL
jgi:uncharacterized protein (TIGR02271 family)